MKVLDYPRTQFETIFTEVDGVEYRFTYRYNNRDCSWYLSIARGDNQDIIKFKITSGVDLLKPYSTYENLPKGELYLIDLGEGTGRITLPEFSQNDRFGLLYLSPEDIQA